MIRLKTIAALTLACTMMLGLAGCHRHHHDHYDHHDVDHDHDGDRH
ncbi:hypothetical protein [Granulicella mallensis]|jgi:hypothetical protein|uniref:Lipoprotein n=1 Tax=Granulicella mallensis TaxID=940614 RepID=A0A7W7ZWC1_9BACT|nr:hypothetical protein [Granulicella mallensis]MBB5066898.1 hypothetical protein [Granulicella mallensis]